MPSKLILPLNITLVEQGNKLLTLRGEHFYFTGNIAVTLNLCIPPWLRAQPPS